MKITSVQQANDYLFSFIPQTAEFKFPGQLGLERSRYLLRALGSPQEKIKVIHIAGTSGKGSTANFTAAFLKSQRFTVGLHVSPHLVDIRERFQIDNKLVSEKELCMYLTEIIPAIETTTKSRYGKPTYFEILVALSFYIFYKKGVDYAVVETGLGGWYDGTNIVSSRNKLCILTRIGLDHTRILGKTYKEIANQKVHIVQRGNSVITIQQKPNAQTVIERFIKKQNGRLITIVVDKTLKIHALGDFQKENCSLAITALYYLSKRDGFVINEQKLKNALKTTRIKGRFEVFRRDGKYIIVDGAHNPQKMAAFTASLQKQFKNKKFTFLVAFKDGKDIEGMLRYIYPIAGKIVVTQFWINTTYSKLSLSVNPKRVEQIFRKHTFKNYELVDNSKKAIEKLIKSRKDFVITGSIYFIGEVYPLVDTL